MWVGEKGGGRGAMTMRHGKLEIFYNTTRNESVKDGRCLVGRLPAAE